MTALRDGAPEILLVEDDPDDLELALRAIREHRVAVRIEVARDGAEALRLLDAQDRLPTVVILDLGLPKVDGLEVLRRIRMDLRTRCLPVVVLSSSSEQGTVLESYRLGVNSYVRKPVDADGFSSCVRDLGHYWVGVNEAPPEGP
jgi:two-component system response regulator